MRRREFLIGCAAAMLPSRALAQRAPRRIGYVSWFSPELAVHADELRKGLRDLGYLDGREVVLDTHFTSGDREKTREVLRGLLSRGTDILVVEATPAIALAKELAGSLPIVMTIVSDPIAAGFAQSLSHPGGTMTGRTMLGPNLAGKRIDLIKEMKPELKTVAFLGSSRDANTPRFVEGTKEETDRAGLNLLVRSVDAPPAINSALLTGLKQDGAEVVIVQPIFTGHHKPILDLAGQAGLPVVSDWVMFAEAGAVFTLGIDTYASVRRAAYYVDRIFKGTPPADLPIENPTEVKLTVNAAAARRFGWAVPPSLLARADEVIE
jgi:putative ABC transport system substrate-binding protein